MRARRLLGPSRRRPRPSARGSLSGTRSSACRRTPRPRWYGRPSSADAVELPSSRRCSSVRRRGTRDVDEHALVAAAESLQHRHRRGRASTRISPGCVPGSNSNSISPSSVGTVDRGAERRLRHRQVDGARRFVALADEPLVGPDADEDVDVAGAAAQRRRRGLRRESRMRCPSWMPGGISTSSARSSSTRPAPLAAPRTGARRRVPRPSQRGRLRCGRTRRIRSRHVLDTAGAAAVGHGRRLVPGSTPSPPHSLARHRDLRRGRSRSTPVRGLVERRSRPRRRRRRRGAAAVPARRRRGRRRRRRRRCRRGCRSRSRRAEAAAAQPGVAEAVVELARLAIREHLVGLDDLLEALRRRRAHRRRRGGARARAGGTPA